MLDMEILASEISKATRTAVRKYGVSYEDHMQDLWVWMLEKKPDHLGTARAMLTNRSIDLCRQKVRKSNGLRSVDFEDPLGELFVNSEATSAEISKSIFDNAEDMIIVESAISCLKVGSRERCFAVCKAYLIEGFEFLKAEFNSYFENLSDDEKKLVLSADKITDDLISKVFLKIRTGTNSGSMRTIKFNLRKWQKEAL